MGFTFEAGSPMMGGILWTSVVLKGDMSYTEKYDCPVPQCDDFLRTTGSRKTGKGNI